MIGTLFIFLVALVIGWRRGVVDSKAVGGIIAYGLFMGIVAVVGNLSFKPWLAMPGVAQWILVFFSYMIPAGLGYALGTAAKKQRLRNDAEDAS